MRHPIREFSYDLSTQHRHPSVAIRACGTAGQRLVDGLSAAYSAAASIAIRKTPQP